MLRKYKSMCLETILLDHPIPSSVKNLQDIKSQFN